MWMRAIASRGCEAASAAVTVAAVVAADGLPVLVEAALGLGWCGEGGDPGDQQNSSRRSSPLASVMGEGGVAHGSSVGHVA